MINISALNELSKEALAKANRTEIQILQDEVKEMQKLLLLKALEVEASRVQEVKGEGMAKNHVMGKMSEGRTYTILLASLPSWGNVPQQQKDIATLLLKHMEVGTAYSEKDVFDFLIADQGKYTSLSRSVQHVTYLFKYYRGLKNNGKQAGFIARLFMKVLG